MAEKEDMEVGEAVTEEVDTLGEEVVNEEEGEEVVDMVEEEVVGMVEEEVVVREEEEEGQLWRRGWLQWERRFWPRRWLHPRVTRLHLTGLWTVARCKSGFICLLFACQSHHLSPHTLFLDDTLSPPHLSPHRHKEGGTSH